MSLPASDDRFSNPKSKLYAVPDGDRNTAEVRVNTDSTAYKFNGTFSLISKLVIAVKDLRTPLFDFGIDTRPAPRNYKITSKGSTAQKTIRLLFAKVSKSRVPERSPQNGARHR